MELAAHVRSLEARGYGLCTISYDPVEVLRDFAARRKISYPMLSDPDSAIIRAFGLLNTEVHPGIREYGVPYPAILFVDRAGVVTRRYAEEKYYHRRTMATILTGEPPTATLVPTAVAAGDHVTIGSLTVQEAVHPGNRFALFAEVTPHPGVHLCAPGAGGAYRALTLTIREQPAMTLYPPEYPAPDATWTSPLGERIPVYAGRTRIKFEVALGTRQELQRVYDAGGMLRIEGTLTLQACSETICWPPEEVPVAWDLKLIPPDLERPPEPLRREELLRRRQESP